MEVIEVVQKLKYDADTLALDMLQEKLNKIKDTLAEIRNMGIDINLSINVSNS